MALKIELKRYNGSDYDTLYPKTSWANVEDKPSTYTPTSHSHSEYEPAVSAGTTSQYWRGDKTWATLPSTTETDPVFSASAAAGITSTNITNWGTAYTHSQATHAPSTAQKNSDITKAEIEAKLTGTITTHAHNYPVTSVNSKTGAVSLTASDVGAEPAITAGTTAQYYRGDKSWVAFPTIPTIPSVMDTTEGNAGTATTQRTINAANLKTIILNHSPAGSRPASDVSSWAKASTKPSYSWSEIGSRPTKVSDFTNDSGFITSTVGSDITLSPAGTAQADQKAIKWKSINSKNPYFGYALDQTDGTFVWSITGTNYASGLAIGGGSGNLLYKGGVVVTANNISSYAATTSHTHTLSEVSAHISESQGGVNIYGYPNDENTHLFLGDDGTFEHSGNTVITSANVSSYVSSGATITSLKNWTGSLTVDGTGTSVSATLINGAYVLNGLIGIVWNSESSSAGHDFVTWVKFGSTLSSYYLTPSLGRTTSYSSTTSYITNFTIRVSSSGSVINFSYAFRASISTTVSRATTTIYIRDILQMV